MTNADGTTGCYPPGRGFESRRIHQTRVRSSVVRAGADPNGPATFHHSCRHDLRVLKGLERRGECRTELQHSSGNPRGSTPRLAGALWHERDPGVSSTLVAAAREQFQQKRVAVLRPELPQNKEMEHDGDFLFSRKRSGNRRMLAGLQGSAPVAGREVGCSNHPSPSGEVAQQKRSCRSCRRCGECLRDYRDRAPALRKAGGRVFNPPLSGSSGKVAQYRLANLVAVFAGKTNECRTTLGLAVRIRPAVSAEWSCRDSSSSWPNSGCRPDYKVDATCPRRCRKT